MFITFTNGLNPVGFIFNDQSYFEWNLADKIFRFCLLALDECQTVVCWIKNLGY